MEDVLDWELLEEVSWKDRAGNRTGCSADSEDIVW